MPKRSPKEINEEVLKKIREGQKVTDVSKAYGINESLHLGVLHTSYIPVATLIPSLQISQLCRSVISTMDFFIEAPLPPLYSHLLETIVEFIHITS